MGWTLREGGRGGRCRRGCRSRVVHLLSAAVAFCEVIGRLTQCGVGRRRLGRRVNRAGGGEGFSAQLQRRVVQLLGQRLDGERDRREGTEKLPVLAQFLQKSGWKHLRVFVGDLDGLLNESLRLVSRLRHLATLSDSSAFAHNGYPPNPP